MDNRPVIGGDVLLVPFFLAASQRKVTKTYDCRGKRKGVEKGFQGVQGQGIKALCFRVREVNGFEPVALTL